MIREFNLKDYDLYKRWWKKDGVNPPPLSSLPRIGLVYGDMKAVGFLADTDTDFGIITFWHSNPENSARDSYESIKSLTKCLVDAAIAIGKTKVFCYTNNRGMIRVLESLGFINHDGHLIVEAF